MHTEDSLSLLLDSLDKKINLLLDIVADDAADRELLTVELSDKSLELMKEADLDFTQDSIKVLEKIIPSSHPEFASLIGSCMLLAMVQLHISDDSKSAENYMVCLADLLYILIRKGGV